MFKPTATKRAIFFIIVDTVLSLFTLYLAYLLRFNFEIPKEFLNSFFRVYYVLVSLKIFFLFIFKIYFFNWRFFSLNEAKELLYAHILSYISFLAIFLIFKNFFMPFPRSVIIIDFFLSIFFIGGIRFAKRVINEGKKVDNLKPLLVVGANSRSNTLIKHFINEKKDFWPVAIVDDDKYTINSYISNIKVYPFEKLNEITKNYNVKSAVIAKDLSKKELDSMFETLKQAGIKDIKIAKFLGDRVERLKDISIEDLLARKPKDLDKEVIKNFIKDRVVLITGAGGSIGSEITRQCKKFGAKKLILVDNSEFNLYKIGEELDFLNNKDLVIPVMDSVVDKDLIENIFKKYRPQIVIHAAAYKHVPLVEFNPKEAVINNILGTKNVIDLSIKYEVEKVVLISTDKAVRPTNVMGATKRVCELYAQNVDSKKSEIVAVRFGNVLGSSGSVIPKFKSQIQNGGPVTVTHPEITRYFMLIPEACELVLQAAAIAKGKEIFILDMGEPVKIVDLAKKMIKLYGKEDEVEIVFTGLRPGEKLYEELLLDESEKKTKYESIFIAKATKYDIDKLNKDIDELLKSNNIKEKLKEIVKEFNPKP